MSLPMKLARSIMPPVVRRPIKRVLTQAYRVASYPFNTPLTREIHRLERRSSLKPLQPLKEFPELEDSAWQGLQGLAYQLVRHYKPKVVVELGTHMGLSAMAMGLALRDIGEGGKLYAVDSWAGDPQAGEYGEEVYKTFLERRDQLGLGEVIVPLKMMFVDAYAKVGRPIDLLHVDGLHTWEAVTEDWETYEPLIRPGGMALFHDVNAGFEGVKKFWREMKKMHETYTVPYSFGLGVLRTKQQ